MPKRYQAMRDKFMGKGMSEDAAEEKAAKIYNATKKPGEPDRTTPGMAGMRWCSRSA